MCDDFVTRTLDDYDRQVRLAQENKEHYQDEILKHADILHDNKYLRDQYRAANDEKSRIQV